jgi:hypothetical protein
MYMPSDLRGLEALKRQHIKGYAGNKRTSRWVEMSQRDSAAMEIIDLTQED